MAELVVTSGKPLSQQFRIPGAKLVWPALDLVEVRAQLRKGPRLVDDLITNLQDYMSLTFQANDLLVMWNMTGLQTQAMCLLMWNSTDKGIFNLVVSDIGVVDARSVISPPITVRKVNNTTSVLGVL